MDAIGKLLGKMSRKDKARILKVLEDLRSGTLSGIKLQGKDSYRIRVGDYRIIYHLESGGPVVDAVRRRNEGTYTG